MMIKRNKFAKRLLRAVCAIGMAAALLAGQAALAVDSGVYLATASPHYQHPVTGEIEDSGGEDSSVLGQSMTESALYQQALVEVDSAGNIYVTVRLLLMNSIQNPQFSVDGTACDAALMQEDLATDTGSADYRMQVPSVDSVIRCTMYVVPMGRDVIFYITVSDLQSGSGDFVVSLTQDQTAAQTDTGTQTATTQTENAATTTQAADTTTTDAAQTEEESVEAIAETAEDTDTGSAKEIAEGSAETANASGSAEEADKAGETDSGSNTTTIVVVIVIIAAIAAGVWYYRKQKGEDDEA